MMQRETIEAIRKMLEGFDKDPPVTPFQEGYYACLKVIWTEVLKQSSWEKVPYSA